MLPEPHGQASCRRTPRGIPRPQPTEGVSPPRGSHQQGVENSLSTCTGPWTNMHRSIAHTDRASLQKIVEKRCHEYARLPQTPPDASFGVLAARLLIVRVSQSHQKL